LRGTPADVPYVLEEICRQKENPYDGLARFRLAGVDAQGVEWSLGWTIPEVDNDGDVWTFEGELDGLSPEDRSASVSMDSSTEVIFRIPIHHPAGRLLRHFLPPTCGGDTLEGSKSLDVLGSQVRVVYEPSCATLSITAVHSNQLPPTLTENWLGEPLRVLFGQLIFPRLVARNLGRGRSIISIRRTLPLFQGVGWSALWAHEPSMGSADTF
jgi:hypothetical protein